MRSILASAVASALLLAACGSEPDVSSTAQSSNDIKTPRAADCNHVAPEPKITVRLREVERVLTLAPGETVTVVSTCSADEAVVGGSPTKSSANMTVTPGGLIFDGVHSGWAADFRNSSNGSAGVNIAVGALCVRGQLIAK